LDETRLLILGGQILFGFHLNATFQQAFMELPISSRWLHGFSFVAMAAMIGLLIAPSMQHRIVDGGQSNERIVQSSAWFAAVALPPFAFSLGADIFIVTDLHLGSVFGPLLGMGFTIVALVAWYAAPLARRDPQSKEAL
jgi:Family of unknown function (DUF6328)